MLPYFVGIEGCALVFLLVITVTYALSRKIPCIQNTLFLLIMYCSAIDLLCNVASAFTAEAASEVPLWLNYALHSGVYLFHIFISFLVFVFVLSLEKHRFGYHSLLLLLPLVAAVAMLIANTCKPFVFFFRADGIVYGIGHYILLALWASYTLLTALSTVVYRGRMHRKDCAIIRLNTVLILLSAYLAYKLPEYPTYGVLRTLAVLLLYIQVQNPSSRLNSTTGMFNFSALRRYFRFRLMHDNRAYVTFLSVGGLDRITSSHGIHKANAVREKLGNYLNLLCRYDGLAFHIVDTGFLLVSNNKILHAALPRLITERFSQPFTVGAEEYRLEATVRYSVGKLTLTSPDDISHLMELLYKGGASGQIGSALPITKDTLEALHREAQVLEAIKRALATGRGFSLRFQPIYSVKEGKFESAEVLLRLYDRELGFIPPSEFVPLAERTGLIERLDCVVLDLTERFLRSHPELRDKGLSALHINLSAMDFRHAADRLAERIMTLFGNSPYRICFEITETVATLHADTLEGFMKQLCGAGFVFALDDFGTGYSNIAMLMQLEFAYVKIDRCFSAPTNEQSAELLRDMVKVFGNLHLTTVLEGVETEAQVLSATDMGVDEFQGYYFSKPLSENAFVKLWNR